MLSKQVSVFASPFLGLEHFWAMTSALCSLMYVLSSKLCIDYEHWFCYLADEVASQDKGVSQEHCICLGSVASLIGFLFILCHVWCHLLRVLPGPVSYIYHFPLTGGGGGLELKCPCAL